MKVDRKRETDSNENDQITRKLRSKGTTKIDESLFNFEENEEAIDPDQPITVVRSMRKGTPMELKESQQAPSKLNATLNIVKAGISSRRALRTPKIITKKILNVNIRVKDPLSEMVYLNYHRRMEKEEKRMANRDREKIHSEADRMRSQLDALQQSDNWFKVLPTITYIRNTKDAEEMAQKRDWTIDSLQLLLSKYEDWKKKEEKLLGLSKRSQSPTFNTSEHSCDLTLYTNLNKYDYIGDSDTDEEEDNMSVQEIKLKRHRKRTQRFGPVIKIKFGDHMVVAEPFRATRIEELKPH